MVSAIADRPRRSRARRPTSSADEVLGVGGGAAVAEGQHPAARAAGSRRCGRRPRAAAERSRRKSAASVRRCPRRAAGCHRCSSGAHYEGRRQRSCERTGIDSRGASGGLGGAAQHPPSSDTPKVHGQQDRGDGGLVRADLEHRALAQPGRNVHRDRQAAEHAALAPAAVAVEEAPARARAGVAGAVTGTSSDKTVPAAASSGRSTISAVRLVGRERPAQVARRGAPRERPVERGCAGRGRRARRRSAGGARRRSGSRRPPAARHTRPRPRSGAKRRASFWNARRMARGARITRNAEQLVVVLGLLHPGPHHRLGSERVSSRRGGAGPEREPDLVTQRRPPAVRARPASSGARNRGRRAGSGMSSTDTAATAVRASGAVEQSRRRAAAPGGRRAGRPRARSRQRPCACPLAGTATSIGSPSGRRPRAVSARSRTRCVAASWLSRRTRAAAHVEAERLGADANGLAGIRAEGQQQEGALAGHRGVAGARPAALERVLDEQRQRVQPGLRRRGSEVERDCSLGPAARGRPEGCAVAAPRTARPAPRSARPERRRGW